MSYKIEGALRPNRVPKKIGRRLSEMDSIKKLDGPNWIQVEDNYIVIKTPKVEKETAFIATFRMERNEGVPKWIAKRNKNLFKI